MDKDQKAKFKTEMQRLMTKERDDLITFAGVCVNLYIANKAGKRNSMDAWLHANNLTFLKQVSNLDLIDMAHIALGNYLKIDPGGKDTFDEHFQFSTL